MNLLHRMVVRLAIPVFISSLLFFVLILQMVDLFGNIWRYLQNDVPVMAILRVAYLYLPKCVSFALPIATLFAISFTLGNLYANNELIAILGSGIHLLYFVMPLMILGFLLSIFSFYFEEKIVINSYLQKNTLTQELWNQKTSLSNNNVIVHDSSNHVTYKADYYNDKSGTLSTVTIILFDKDNNFEKRFEARYARWIEDHWELTDVREFLFEEKYMIEVKHNVYAPPRLVETPETFRKNVYNIEEMQIPAAKRLIANLKRSGLDYREALTQYYQRYSFALTPFIVSIISCAIGSRFKKNILLMSLFISLSISVLYYVLQMVLVVMANTGVLPPILGAWGALIVFMASSFILFRFIRT